MILTETYIKEKLINPVVKKIMTYSPLISESLTESYIKNVLIKPIVEKVLKEAIDSDLLTYYRGYDGDSIDNGYCMWISPDIDFAKEYGDKIAEIHLNYQNLNLFTEYDAEDITNEYDDSISTEDLLYEPTPGFVKFCENLGYDGYEMDNESICLFKKSYNKISYV
jgi:hypothetical protein